MKPRYAELAEQLIQAIGDGTFVIGAAMPSELGLSAQYGVSRATVRSALALLQERGLISRRKRAGIRVEAIKPRVAYEQSLGSVEDLVQFAAMTERHVQSTLEIEVAGPLAAQLGVAPHTRWLRAEMLRVDPAMPEKPICWTDVYIEPLIGQAIKSDLRKSTGLICEMVEHRFGRVVREVRQEIRAVGIPARIAAKLMAEEGGHALEITRHYVDQNGIVFEATVSTFPAERFTYALQLRRQD